MLNSKHLLLVLNKILVFFFFFKGENRRFVFKDLYDNIIEENKIFNSPWLNINLRCATNYFSL